jgi:hypothetical protein
VAAKPHIETDPTNNPTRSAEPWPPIESPDRLKLHAAEQGRTIGAHLAALADDADRAGRFARLRQQVAATPAALRASYAKETAAWDQSSGDGLAAEDFSDWPGYAAS